MAFANYVLRFSASRINPASLQERQAREARAQAFAQGTTPYGREIFRRLLDLAWRRVAEHKRTLEVVREVCDEIAIFPELHAEFVLMLGRTLREDRETLGLSSTPANDPTQFEDTTPWAWASLMVWRAGLAQKLNAQSWEHQGQCRGRTWRLLSFIF